MTELEDNILSISGLPTNSALTRIEDKMLVVYSEKQIRMKKISEKRILPIITTINILLLQNSISLLQKCLLQN